MKVAAIQMNSTARLQDNLNQASSLLDEAARKGTQLAALPEYFYAFTQNTNINLSLAENYLRQPNNTTPIQYMLANKAKELNMWIVAGSLPLRSSSSKTHLYNACLVFSNKGELINRYDKIHLFHFDDGCESYDETSLYLAGTQAQRFEWTSEQETYQCGLSICYDLRFPELYRQLSPINAKACDVIFVPSAFTYTTGQDHWEVLLRARAIENQCYIVAPAQTGSHDHGHRTWGHSMIINPWGKIIAIKEDDAGVITADIDHDSLLAIRSKLPALSNRVLTE